MTTSIKTSIESLRSNWKDDLKAGFNVSLIALPLSLGIAIGSGFPPIAGLFAAIVGGLLVSRINGSNVTITGPAAGLIVVNLAAVEMLGQGDPVAGYKYTLAAIVVAGFFISIFGFLKSGKFGDFFPSSAVHGMLAAIGVIIISKQLFVAMAVRAHGHEIYEIIEEIPIAIRHANPEVVLIALISLAILIFYPRTKNRYVRLLPAPIWVLLIAIPLEFLMDFEHEHEVIFLGEHHKVGPQLLVHLPENLGDGFMLPDFGKVITAAFWISVVTIALVTAIESLLSALAVDSLDPQKRKSDLNKDLKALGVGSSVSAAVGGLPMISEIVRSSANIASGAKTQWSNFFHGGFLLIFLLVGGPIIDHIPLAALSAMLIFTGYRLASPKEFKHVYHIGISELIIFVTTILAVLLTDLLIGIGIGIMMAFLINMYYGTTVSNLFKVRLNIKEDTGKVTFTLRDSLVFSNYLGLKKHILAHAHQSVILDFSKVTYADHSTIHHLHGLEADFHHKGLDFQMIGMEHLTQISNHFSSALVVATKQQPKQKNLNAHQEQLAAFAEKNGLRFETHKKVSTSDFSRLEILKGAKIHHSKNHLSGDLDGVSFYYTELEYDADLSTASTDGVIPMIVLSPKKHVPVFTLRREQALDKVAQMAGFEDIDFHEHSEFSEKFLLRGEKEDEIRSFFTPDRIELVKQHPDFQMESNGKKLIIFRRDHEASVESLEDLVRFSTSIL